MNDDERLHRTILDSIWARLQWDFLLQNPQLSEMLSGSRLQATDEPDLFRIVVASGNPPGAASQWLDAHSFAIRRSLSVEMKRPVDVRVVAAEGVK